MFNFKIEDRKVSITFAVAVLLGKFFKDILTTLRSLELGILVYKDLTSRNIKYGIFFYFVDFFVKSHLYLAYKMVFELLPNGDNLHALKYLMWDNEYLVYVLLILNHSATFLVISFSF